MWRQAAFVRSGPWWAAVEEEVLRSKWMYSLSSGSFIPEFAWLTRIPCANLLTMAIKQICLVFRSEICATPPWWNTCRFFTAASISVVVWRAKIGAFCAIAFRAIVTHSDDALCQPLNILYEPGGSELQIDSCAELYNRYEPFHKPKDCVTPW